MHDAVQYRGALMALTAAAILIGCANQDVAPTELRPSTSAADITFTTPEFNIAATSAFEASLSVATDGTNALVPLNVDGYMKAKLVSKAGAVLASINTGRLGDFPLAAFDGTNYFVVWTDGTDTTGRAWGMRISKTGTVVQAPFAVSADKHIHHVFGVAYAPTANKYLVLYRNGNVYQTGLHAMRGRFVAPNGTLGSTITIAGKAGDQGFSNLATNGTNFLALFTDTTNGKVLTKIVHADGTMTTAVAVATSAVADAPIAAGYANGKYLVVWNKYVSSSVANPTAQLLTGDGVLSGGKITIDATTKWETAAQVVTVGANFFVGYFTWVSTGNDMVYGRMITSTGTVGAPQQYFTKSSTTNKVAVPFGIAIGTKLFFVIDRVLIDLANYKKFTAATGWDVRGALITP